ncbi:MAG: nucleotidyltransferase family protein [Candidatus Bipolaricaulota bacterium]
MSSRPYELTPILLAGGGATRFGGLKQLVELGGKPLIRWPMEAIGELNWTYDPLLVLGYRAEEIKASIDTSHFRVLENDSWGEGLSSSVKLGVSSVEDGTTGLLLFLADMPLITPSLITRVIEAREPGSSIVAPAYKEQRGFPVLLDRRWKRALSTEISGDRGARRLISENRDELKLVETDWKGVVLDVDEKSDVEEIETYLKEEGEEIGV